LIESPNEEEEEEEEEDSEREYDENEMALFIKKFNKGERKEKTRSKRVCYNCGKNGHFIVQCPYERKEEENDKRKKFDKGYKKGKKYTKKKSYGQAHIGQEWNSSGCAQLLWMRSMSPSVVVVHNYFECGKLLRIMVTL
jgi:hypothetical protein